MQISELQFRMSRGWGPGICILNAVASDSDALPARLGNSSYIQAREDTAPKWRGRGPAGEEREDSLGRAWGGSRRSSERVGTQ